MVNTGGWRTWQTISETITLRAGTHALFVYMPAGSFNLGKEVPDERFDEVMDYLRDEWRGARAGSLF